MTKKNYVTMGIIVVVLIITTSLTNFFMGGKRNFRRICELAEIHLYSQEDPAMKAYKFAEAVNKEIYHLGLRETFAAIAHADPAQKYGFFLDSAQDAGLENWQCPALENYFSPGDDDSEPSSD